MVIGKRLNISKQTAARAYWSHRREAQTAAVEAGRKPPSAKYSHIGLQKVEQIRQWAASGLKPAEIAAKAGVSVGTIHRALKQS